jgi:CDP-diacylglycerol--glycerol-3-phosphate 3-phosphatidyltransferase
MLTLPNILTTIRLIAAPMVALMFLYFTRPYADWAALILFVGAALTDWLDGFLARVWKQESKLGRMLDPIADKVMVVIALLVLTSIFGLNPLILLPAAIIVFRETFVSGLREFLGDTASTLQVTKLAKWKTTSQMIAIALLFAVGIFEFCLEIDPTQQGISLVPDTSLSHAEISNDFGFCYAGMNFVWYGGIILLWVAASLTLITGADYFRKALSHLYD